MLWGDLELNGVGESVLMWLRGDLRVMITDFRE